MKKRLSIAIRGAVQGVGFRPFIYRLAAETHLAGWVLNSPQGVFIEAEGEENTLSTFLLRIEQEKPPRSSIQSLESTVLDPAGYTTFEIRPSRTNGSTTVIALADIATCPDCLGDLSDPSNRRYRYPFTNCTNCGPRYTIIEELPYDRPHTTMNRFTMCDDCRKEYENPLDRRFHAQPNACQVCGPQLEFWDPVGKTLARKDDALEKAAEAIRRGSIVAVKGIGGFHLMVDARNEEAVLRLRQRKRREEKPFAVMFPSLAGVRPVCALDSLEERLLASPESPIVLLQKRKEPGVSDSSLAPSIAPGNPYLGVMLPYSPLHYLLLHDLGFPVVATSGNLSDEPICIDEHEAVDRLNDVVDHFLVHNRPIRRHVDDSIVRIMLGREFVLRRARGYAPLPIPLGDTVDEPILALGAHLKNTVALAVGSNTFISQHIGDLETMESHQAFEQVIASFRQLYRTTDCTVACDLHPDYLSTKFARNLTSTPESVQHHYAHIASCMAENRLDGKVLGVSWDGTGFGTDGTIWGGEFLLTNEASFTRVFTFRQFPLPGGEQAIREPRRSALGLLYEIYGQELFSRSDVGILSRFSREELALLKKMLDRKVHSPRTSSVGRLFDAAAALLSFRAHSSFEGQAAMEMEFSMAQTEIAYPYKISAGISQYMDNQSASPVRVIDWEPMIRSMLNDISAGLPKPVISAKFHNTLVAIIVAVAREVGEQRIVLSGGCFQNKYLTEQAVLRLWEAGFQPYWHQRVPPNDGGISLGQINAVVRARKARIPVVGSAGEHV